MKEYNSPLRCIDLFAGAGGFSCAAKSIGLTVVAALEIDKHACETYRKNFITNRKNAPILFENDITQLAPETFIDKLKENDNTASVDIIVGGPPCQGFSTHRINNAGVDDPRNKLLYRYFDYITALNPKVFVLENVSGMLWQRHKEYLSNFYDCAEKNGYILEKPVILDAKNFGVPQNRRRVFILGRKKNINWSSEFLWPPKPTHFSPNSKEVQILNYPSWNTAGDVFDKPHTAGDPNDVHMNHSHKMINVFKSTPQNGGSRNESNRELECHKKHDGHKDVYGRICTTKPGPTMTTGCVNPSKGRFLHPFDDHGITVRQAARFQTFPDDFIFEGGLMSASRQVGNAVPVKLAGIILELLVSELQQMSDKQG